jgi:ribosomal subunit interface protein
MNIDIQTEHVAMRPEWHHMIDEWLERCARCHPDVVDIDVRLRHDDRRQSGEEVNVEATADGRTLRASKQAEVMTVALHDALDGLEHELLAHQAIRRRPPHHCARRRLDGPTAVHGTEPAENHLTRTLSLHP